MAAQEVIADGSPTESNEPPADSMDRPSEGLRIRRVLSRFIGGGYVVYFLVSLTRMPSDAVTVASWWTSVAVLLAFGPGWLLLAVSILPTRRQLYVPMSALCALGYVAALGLWLVAWNGQTSNADGASWLMLFPGLASLAVTVGRWPWLAGVHLLLAVAMSYVANRIVQSDPALVRVMLPNAIWALAFSAPFVGAAIMAVRAGDLLDATRDDTVRRAAEMAAEQVRGEERARLDALVHDGVLAVLLSAKKQIGGAVLPDQARKALADLLSVSDDSADDVMEVGALVAALRRAAREASANAVVTGPSGQARDGAPFVIPTQVARAVVDATAEAVRNSTRHGDRDDSVAVSIWLDDARVIVRIGDSGPGFERRRVRSDRLGLRVSIEGRMAAVGGRADIESEPGRGTQVVLCWPTT